MAYSGKRRKDGYGEEEVRENVKAPRLWMLDNDQDADCITSVNNKGLNIDHWMRVHQKLEAAAPSVPLGSFQQRATASAMALQDIPNIDPTRPPVFQAQAQAQAQSQSQSQGQAQSVTQLQLVKLSMQQQQKLQQQQLQHQQQQLQQKQIQQQQLQQKQVQHQQLKQEQLQHQQLQQQLLQQEQLQQEQLRWLQQQNAAPNCFGPLMERSSICSPTPIVMPSTLRTCQLLYGDWDLQNPLSAAPSCSYPVQNSCISRPQSSSSLISDAGNDHVSSLLSNNHSEAQHPPGNLAAAGILVQEPQMAASWLPSSSRDSSTADTQLMTPYSITGRFDTASVPGCLFSSSLNEQTDQLGLSSLPLQQSPVLHRSSMKEQEQVQPDLVLPCTVLPTAPTMPSMGTADTSGMLSRMLNQLTPQNQIAYGKQPLVGQYSAPGPASDPPTNLNAVVNGSCVNEGGIPHQILPLAPPRRACTRTYTKVYKLGSIGRAVDVNRFKNYTELRCELARMFGLEGQLDRKSGWQLVFIDNENDILLVGDDPWEEFVSSVRGIRILSPAEVAYYMNSDERVGAPYNCLNSSVMKRF